MEMRRGRSRPLVIIIVLFVLAILVAAATLGVFWYRKMHTAEENTSSSGGSISLDTKKKIETENLQTAVVIPKATDKPGDTIKISVLSATFPKVWRTVNAKSLLNTPLEGIYATSYNDILAQFIMVPETRPTDLVQTTNSLSFFNITNWLAKPSVGSGGTVTTAAKAAYIQNLVNIADGKPANPKACDKGFSILNPSLCGTLLKPTAVATADGTLKGVVFLNTTAQSVSYDPQAIVFLTGQVKDQQIFAYGLFHLLDNNSHTLTMSDEDGIKTAWDSFVSGAVPADTLELYEHVVTAVKSVSIQAN